uniref:4-hydroxy-tetrahydrodipicolinate synthase n=1 Tax=Oceanivirga salmonicida TaxID=1769291 RepID=UPI001E38FA6D|nr:4-hydroxy-tetrahydrodipicolinate synthase [Oceanivirga salmonicida]
MSKLKLKGAFVAIVTPFNDDGSVDYKTLEKLVEFQIQNGIAGIVPCGTTGETPTLSEQEYIDVISTVIKKVDKRVLVIAGAGANSTKKAVELSKKCMELGADAVLSTCPYYNKPSQRGIKAHYEEINKLGIPIVVYNVPGRTGVNIQANTMFELSKLENVVAVKEASGIIEQMIEIKLLCGDNISILSGEDHLIMPMSVIGCDGVISVTANILPDKVSKFYNSNSKYEIHEYLYEISRNMFIEGNPTTVKEAMDILGLCKNNLRLPLVKATNETREKLNNLLKEKGLVK